MMAATGRRWCFQALRYARSCSNATTSTTSTAAPVIRFVAINDVYELTNLPKLATFVQHLELDQRPVDAVVCAGDFLSPSLLSGIDRGRGMVETLNVVQYTSHRQRCAAS